MANEPRTSWGRVIVDKVGALETEVESVGTDVGVIKTDVGVLKSDSRSFKADLAAMKADIAEIKVDIAIIKVDMAILKASVAEIHAQLSDFIHRFIALEARVNTLVDVFKWFVGIVGGAFVAGIVAMVYSTLSLNATVASHEKRLIEIENKVSHPAPAIPSIRP